MEAELPIQTYGPGSHRLGALELEALGPGWMLHLGSGALNVSISRKDVIRRSKILSLEIKASFKVD